MKQRESPWTSAVSGELAVQHLGGGWFSHPGQAAALYPLKKIGESSRGGLGGLPTGDGVLTAFFFPSHKGVCCEASTRGGKCCGGFTKPYGRDSALCRDHPGFSPPLSFPLSFSDGEGRGEHSHAPFGVGRKVRP